MNSIAAISRDVNHRWPIPLKFRVLRLWMLLTLVCFPLTLHASQVSTLTLTAYGYIESTCGIENNLMEPVSLTLGQAKRIEFSINCNSPFKYSVTSRFGGLQHTPENTFGSVDDSFLQLISYDLAVYIPLEQGNKSHIQDECASENLVGPQPNCRFSDSGSSIAINQTGDLTIRTDTIDQNSYLSGSYADILVIDVRLL